MKSVNELGFSFPSHLEQRVIAAGFCEMSGAMSVNIIGALDILLI